MSDYGFATYDEKTGQMSEKINSKYPVFGPEYNNIAKQFKSYSMVDAHVNSVRTAVLSTPTDLYPIVWDYETNSGINEGYDETCGWIETEILSYEHGMKKRPLGYYYISGTYVKNYRYRLGQNQTKGGSSIGGTFNVPDSGDGTLTISGNVYPKLSGISLGGSINDSSYANQDITLDTIEVMKQSSATGKKVIPIPNSCLSQFAVPIAVQSYRYLDPDNPLPNDPYYVVIDDKKVHIYRRVFWIETIRREQVVVSGNVTDDAYQRVRVIEDYAGSNLDITVYLVPYNMEDLE